MIECKAKQIDLSGGPLRPVKVVEGQQGECARQKFRAVTSNGTRRPPQKPTGSQAEDVLQDGALPTSLPPGTGFRLIVTGRQRHHGGEPNHGPKEPFRSECNLTM